MESKENWNRNWIFPSSLSHTSLSPTSPQTSEESHGHKPFPQPARVTRSIPLRAMGNWSCHWWFVKNYFLKDQRSVKLKLPFSKGLKLLPSFKPQRRPAGLCIGLRCSEPGSEPRQGTVPAQPLQAHPRLALCFWKLSSHFTYSQNLTRAHCRIMQEICKFHQGVILCFFTHYCIMLRQNTNVCTVLK